MDKISISIIIPVYNVNKYIGDCLNSVINQSYTGSIECIIINDCTPDNSIEIANNIIEKYKGNITFKIIEHKENKGLSAARNTGIKHAQGEYLFFLDSDDEISPTCIEVLCKPLQERKYDFIIGNYITTGNISIEVSKLLLDSGEILSNSKIISHYESYLWYMMAWNKLCNTKYIKENSLYFKESLTHEDDLWSFQLACTAQKIYIVNECTYIYKLRDNSIITSNKFNHHIKSLTLVIKYMIEYSINNKVNNIAYNIIYNYKSYTLNQSIKEKKLFKETYKDIRSFKNTDKYCIYNTFKSKLYYYLGNIHTFLPPNIGCMYFYFFLKACKYHPIKRIKNLLHK